MPELANTNDDDFQRRFVVTRRDAQGIDENPYSLIGYQAARKEQSDRAALRSPAVARFTDSQNDFSIDPSSRNYISPLFRSRQELFGIGSRCKKPQIRDTHTNFVDALNNYASHTMDSRGMRFRAPER